MISGAASGFTRGFSGRPNIPSPTATTGALLPPLPAPISIAQLSPQVAGPQRVVPTPGLGGFIQRALPGGETGLQVEAAATNGACTKGFHLNKSDYFLKNGTFIAKGTMCVKNRRRNPLNPRALTRAVARIDAGKIWQSKLSEIATGKFTAAGNRKSCPN